MNNIKLKFPITKATLQTGFNLKKNIIETEKKNVLDNYINNEINLISYKIINSTIDEETYKVLHNNYVTAYIPKVNKEKKCIETIKITTPNTDPNKHMLKAHVSKKQFVQYNFNIPIEKLNTELNSNIKYININNSTVIINDNDINIL
jgi:hypothetical protein